jgi:hypothetical protein
MKKGRAGDQCQKYQWWCAHGLDQGIGHFKSTKAKEFIMKGRVDLEKKNSRVFPCFSHLKILKTAFMGDIKHWLGRRRRRRHRRHRRSRTKNEKKKDDAKSLC